jgi:hypothetical protein
MGIPLLRIEKLVFLVIFIRFITHKRGPTCESYWDSVMRKQNDSPRCIYASPHFKVCVTLYSINI